MKTKACYVYDKDTKEFIGVDIAYKSPLEEDVYIAPPNSTYLKPLANKPLKVSCFADGKWQYFDDFRGEYILNTDTLEFESINHIGSLMPNQCHLSTQTYIDYINQPEKYKIINNVLTDISSTEEYKKMQENIGKHFVNLTTGMVSPIDKIMEIPNGCQVLEKEIYNDYVLDPDKYKVKNAVFTDISDTEEYKQILRERIDKLHQTSADVERALYKVKGIDFDDVLEMAKDSENIDIKALKIELKAKDYYRGNEFVDKVGELLGFSTEQLDNFFKYNDYTYLINRRD